MEWLSRARLPKTHREGSVCIQNNINVSTDVSPFGGADTVRYSLAATCTYCYGTATATKSTTMTSTTTTRRRRQLPNLRNGGIWPALLPRGPSVVQWPAFSGGSLTLDASSSSRGMEPPPQAAPSGNDSGSRLCSTSSSRLFVPRAGRRSRRCLHARRAER